MNKIRTSYKNGLLMFILVFLLLGVLISTGYTEPLDNWYMRYDLNFTWLNGVTYGNGTFVAVGRDDSNGIIFTSSDGVAWTAISGTFLQLNAVAYGNGTFVAVGNQGTILISPDGVTWTERTPCSGTTDNLSTIAYGNGTFVVISDYNTVLTSPDGYTWTLKGDFIGFSYGMCFDQGKFVVVDWGYIYTSPDGITWTERNSGTSYALKGVAYGNGTFVAVGDYGTVVTSPDGATWTERNSGTNSYFYAIAYGNSTFVAVGDYGTVVTSLDGITWTERVPATSSYNTHNGVTYGNGTFVAVDDLGSVVTSLDGITWTERVPATSFLNGVTYGKGTFVAVGRDGSNGIIFTSSDGAAWTAISGTFLQLNAVAYGNGTFVAVGDHGTILISSDGETWIERTPYSGTTDDLHAIAYGNGTFVVLTNSDTTLISSDGYTWKAKTFTLKGCTWYCFYVIPQEIYYGKGKFVALLESYSYLYTSPDGVTWTKRNSGTPYLNGVAYGNGTFVAVGDDGIVVTSPDGVTWTERNSGTNSNFYAVAYGNGTFVAVGYAYPAFIYTSTDGVVWTGKASASSYSVPYGVTYGNSTFVAVGYEIVQSDLIPANRVTLLLPNGGGAIPSGSTYTILWDAPAGAVSFKLQYSMDKGLTWIPITTDFITGTSYDWSVPTPLANKTKCLIKITGYDNAYVMVGTDTSDEPFTIEVVKLSSPNGEENLTSGTIHDITWQTNETNKPVVTVKLFYTKDGGITWKLIGTKSVDDGTYPWTMPYSTRPKTKCKVKVVLKDASGKIVGSDVSDRYFTIQP
jgi:hypothetical protein